MSKRVLLIMLIGIGTLIGTSSTAGAKDAKDEKCEPGDFPPSCEGRYDYNQATTQFDITKAIGLPGRVARMHYSVLAPDGVIGKHSHNGRPCIEYILDGEATETKKDGSGKVTVRVVRKDEVEIESSDIEHWWKNVSKTTVRMIAVDIKTDEKPTFCNCGQPKRESPFKPPRSSAVKVDELGEISLAKEYPDIPGMKDYVMTNRRITLLPGQVTAVENSKVRPSYWYVVKGSPLENRSDREPSPLRPEEFAIEEGDVSFYWENPTAETVVLWMVGFEPRS